MKRSLLRVTPAKAGIQALATCLLLLSFSFAHAGFQEGLAAQKAGDYQKAIQEYLPVAKLGNIEAQIGLGSIYFQLKSYKNSIHWYSQAATQGDSHAIESLGVFYWHGLGVKTDYIEAYNLFLKASRLGSVAANTNLGVMYIKGQGVIKNYSIAKKFLMNAAAQGDSSAIFNLGQLYYFGNIGPVNHKKGVELYFKAAKLGNKLAQAKLGFLYAVGNDVLPKDYVQAYKWFSLAEKQGDKEAANALGIITKRMSASELAEAKALLHS